MKILSYSPSCEAYAEVYDGAGGRKYIDLTPDIASMQVTRQSVGASTFTVTLQNPNWKYNGVFTPMDRIVLFCTKVERKKLLTGYITDCDVFQLYQGDFKLSGQCSLYRIYQLYWDPQIYESGRLLFEHRSTNKEWLGFGQTIIELLTKVGGWPQDKIFIGDIPQEAIEFAHEMYAANLDSSNQLKSMVNDFYEVLSTHGPKASGTVDVAGGDGGILSSDTSGGARYHQTQGNGENCGATAVAVGINILLGLTGDNAYDNLSVWRAMDCDTTVNLLGKTQSFIGNNGLSDKLSAYALPGGSDTHATSAYKDELSQGHVIISSSGAGAPFLNADGSAPRNYEGHWICFYWYDNGTYYANDSAVGSAAGAGVGYSESGLQAWLDGRSYHCAFVIAAKGVSPLKQNSEEAKARGNHQLSGGELGNPLSGESYTVSSSFGPREGTNHNGIDLAATTGTHYYAADDGQVTHSTNDGGYNGGAGNWVVIDHGNGIVTKYMHSSATYVTAGQQVRKGDHIGDVGSTGQSTGPHLHFQVEVNGVPVDPAPYIGL